MKSAGAEQKHSPWPCPDRRFTGAVKGVWVEGGLGPRDGTGRLGGSGEGPVLEASCLDTALSDCKGVMNRFYFRLFHPVFKNSTSGPNAISNINAGDHTENKYIRNKPYQQFCKTKRLRVRVVNREVCFSPPN